MMRASTGYGGSIASVSGVASASDSTNKPTSLGNFPNVSVLQNMSLVNGRMGGAVTQKKNLTDWDGIPSTDILNRFAAIEDKLAAIEGILNNSGMAVGTP